MKKLSWAVVAAFCSVAVGNTYGNEVLKPRSKTVEVKADTSTTTASQFIRVDIKGMSCMACVANVKKTLSAVTGVEDVEVILAPGSAAVKADHSRVTTETVVEAIDKLGYKANPKASQ